MSELIHIVYVSTSTHDLSQLELDELLKSIRAKNKKNNITGLLLYNDGMFIQVIEGDVKRIIDLFELVKSDARHKNIVELLKEPIKKRSFPDWSMGFKRITNEDLKSIHGFSNFMSEDTDWEPDPGIAEQVLFLLNSFRKYT